MDTTEAASRLGTTPRILRQFLRSAVSTFVAVGSGSRYEFTESELVMLGRRFADWRSGERGSTSPKSKPASSPKPLRREPSRKDRQVWEEEGTVQLADIRNPRIRARILADARAAENRLTMLLMSKGMHISQLGDSRKVPA